MVVQRQNQRVVADFIPRLGADIFCLTCRIKYNRTAIAKVTANAHYFDSQFHVQDALSAFTR